MELKRTKEQIIRALRCMAGGRIPCADCEYDAIKHCEEEIAKDTLALIADYERKIADLEKRNALEDMTVLECKTDLTREEILDIMYEGEYIDLKK